MCNRYLFDIVLQSASTFLCKSNRGFGSQKPVQAMAAGGQISACGRCSYLQGVRKEERAGAERGTPVPRELIKPAGGTAVQVEVWAGGKSQGGQATSDNFRSKPLFYFILFFIVIIIIFFCGIKICEINLQNFCSGRHGSVRDRDLK